MICGGEVFEGHGGSSGAGEFGEHCAKILERSVKSYVFQFESGFPTDGPEFGLGGLDRRSTDEEVFF